MTDLVRCSQRMQAVQTPVIPLIAKAIRDNPGTISLAQGVVAYDPPKAIFPAIEKTMRDRKQQLYGAVEGQAELIELIKTKLKQENEINLDLGYEVIVTAGANMAFLNAILAICDPGDEVILLAPYYFNHDMALSIANCKVVIIDTEDNFQPDIAKIQQVISSKTKAIVTISPNNPTGVVYERETLKSINTVCKENGIYHITDEAYEYFVYEDKTHFSPASIENAAEHTISLFSLSKSYGFAGWRIGYMVFPKHLLPALQKIQDTNLICATQISQQAAIAALKVGSQYCKQQLLQISDNRKRCISMLNEIGKYCQFIEPKGAFYVFLKLNTAQSDQQIAKQLIEKHQVALLPGSTFGVSGKNSFLRLSYGALSESDLIIAMERLSDGLSHTIS